MPKLRLHLDADASSKALYTALTERGHDVTRTPNAWMVRDASDVQQLLGATAHGRCVLTFNVRDFIALAQAYRRTRATAASSWQRNRAGCSRR